MGLSLTGLAMIRIHIAGLVVAAFALTALFARVPTDNQPGIWLRRVLTLAAGLAAMVMVLTLFPDVFGVDVLNAADREFFAADVVRRTSESGAIAEGGGPTSLLALPDGLALVLFRPYFFEAAEIQHTLAAVETGLIALLTIWKLPAVIRNLKKWRSNPYVVFSTLYTLGFAFAFSVIRNLGIIARQRGQVLAFFLCFLVYLGWEEPKRRKTTQLPITPGNRLDRAEPAHTSGSRPPA
jgi:hypothetical protein